MPIRFPLSLTVLVVGAGGCHEECKAPFCPSGATIDLVGELPEGALTLTVVDPLLSDPQVCELDARADGSVLWQCDRDEMYRLDDTKDSASLTVELKYTPDSFRLLLEDADGVLLDQVLHPDYRRHTVGDEGCKASCHQAELQLNLPARAG